MVGAFAVPDDVPDLLPCDENDSDPDVLLKRVEALERFAHKARLYRFETNPDTDGSLVEPKTKEFPNALGAFHVDDVLLKRIEALERLAHKARAFIGSFETDADTGKSLAVERSRLSEFPNYAYEMRHCAVCTGSANATQ